MKAESVERTETDSKLKEMSIVELLAVGKRDFLVGNIPEALAALQRAVALSSEKYGTFGIECAEAYYLFGCALLDQARTENEVLGEAVKGVPLSEKTNDAEAEADGDGKGSGVVSDSEADGQEPAPKADREQLAQMVIDALCTPDDNTQKQEKTETDDAAKTTEPVQSDASQAKSDTNGDAKASESEAQADSTTKPKSNEAETAEDNEEESEEEEEDGDSQSGESTGEAEAEADGEERTTLGIAWEWLDLARIVFDKRHRKLTGGEEPSTSRDADDVTETKAADAEASATASAEPEPEMECLARNDPRRCATRLADCHVRLGEVLMERAEFEAAIGEFVSALQIRERQCSSSSSSTDEPKDEERVDADMRALAETHFQLALANQNAERYDDAVSSYERAIETLSARRAQLATRLETAEKDSELAKRLSTDVEDLEGCVADLRQRIADTLDEKRFKSLAQADSALGAGASASPFGATATATTTTAVADATHLVKRKRKSGAEAETNGSEEKENGSNGSIQKDAAGDAEANEDGVPTKVRKVEEDAAPAANA